MSNTLDLMRRRGEMTSGDDPYAGVLWNTYIDPSNVESVSATWCVSPYIELTKEGVYTWYFGKESDTAQIAVAVNEARVVKSAYRNRTSYTYSRVWSGDLWLRMDLWQSGIDDCWVKDPDGAYLFKGKDVQ